MFERNWVIFSPLLNNISKGNDFFNNNYLVIPTLDYTVSSPRLENNRLYVITSSLFMRMLLVKSPELYVKLSEIS